MDLASLCRWCTPGSKGPQSIAIAGRGPVVRIQLPPAESRSNHRFLRLWTLHDVLRALGQPLDRKIRALFERRPSYGSVREALLLQRTIGNQATLRLLARQASNLIGNEPGGGYELTQ